MAYAVVVAGVVVAGAVVFTGLYLKGETLGGLKRALERAGEPAAVSQSAQSEAATSQAQQYDTATLDNFAKCLVAKGMKFYGASWCGWCKQEEDLFGDAKDSLPYVECIDENDQQKLTPACEAAGIQSFPTWQLPDGTKSPGFRTLEDLANLSGCTLGGK